MVRVLNLLVDNLNRAIDLVKIRQSDNLVTGRISSIAGHRQKAETYQVDGHNESRVGRKLQKMQ